MAPSESVERIRRALEDAGCRPGHSSNGYTSRCPAHDDRNPSLSFGLGDSSSLVIKCHAGCEPDAVLGALGLTWRDVLADEENHRPVSPLGRIVATYDYTDEAGRLLYQVCRKEPKTFRPRRPSANGGWTWSMGDVRRVLYRLEALDNADPSTPAYVTEGEKDADRLAAGGLVATTTAGGANAPERTDLTPLNGRHVICLPDNDDAGRRYAADVARLARQAGAASVKVVDLPGLPEKGDVSDWLDQGHTVAELEELAAAAPEAEAKAVAEHRLGFILRELYDRPELLELPMALLEGFLYADRLTALAGREKSGKSTLMGWLASVLSHHVRVLWIGLEEPLGDPVRRFKAFGANPDNIMIVDRLPAGHDDLVRVVGEFKPAAVFIDSLVRYGEGLVTDWHSSAQVTPVMSKLVDLCHHRHIAILISHHARKSDGTFRDSTAIAASVDLLLEMFPDEADPDVRRFAPRGRMSLEPFALRFSGSGFDQVGGHISVADRVLAFIESDPAASKRRIRDAIRGSNGIVDSALEQLEKDGFIMNRGDSRGSKYEVTENGAGTVAARSAARCEAQGETQWGTLSARYRHAIGHDRAPDPLGVSGAARSPMAAHEPGSDEEMREAI